VVSVLAIGFKPGESNGFLGDKNLQHTFYQMGSKAGGPMSYDFMECYPKIPCGISDTDRQNCHPFIHSFILLAPR
jgi:hypothetical protein